MNSVAELTGFSPNLLRAWERRYEILSPQRKSSGHRLYTDADVKVLKVVKSLIDEGRSIGEISALGREHLLSEAPKTVTLPQSNIGDESTARNYQSQLVKLALRLDGSQIEKLLADCFCKFSRDFVFYQIMEGTLKQVGELWMAGEAKVCHEHLISSIFSRYVLDSFYSTKNIDTNAPVVITACLPGEQHELGALLVSYSLATQAKVTYLGSVPFLDLECACLEVKPAWLLLSVTRPALFEVHSARLEEFVAQNQGFKCIVGGSGVGGFKDQIEGLGAIHWPVLGNPLDLANLIRGTPTN